MSLGSIVGNLFSITIALLAFFFWYIIVKAFYVPVYEKKHLRSKAVGVVVFWLVKWLGYLAIALYFLFEF